MTTKFNVGDTVLIKGIVETIYVETTDNEPIYHVRIKGAGTYEAYGIRVKEDVMKGEEERMNTEDDIKQCRTEGIPNEALILNRLQNAEILDDYATKLAQGDDVSSGRMSVAEYDAVISALRYAVSYMRGAL